MAAAQPDFATVTVWLVPLTALGHAETTDYRRLISTEEHARWERFRVADAALQFLVGRALMRAAVGEHTGTAATDLSFAYTVYGKPYVADPPPARGLPCNVSHTQGIVACAIGDGCTPGVDVEPVERDLAIQRISRAYFARREQEALEAAAPDERQKLFLQTWTLKEAYIKACGRGLSIGLDSFRVSPGSSAATIEFDANTDDDPRRWQLATVAVDNEHQLAVAAQCPVHDTAAQIELRWTIPRVDDAGRTHLKTLKAQTVTP